MNYKEIFKFAQDIGYPELIGKELNKTPYYEDWTEKEILLMITLIQKWLKDEYKIFVTVTVEPYKPDQPAYCADCIGLSSKNMGERLLDGFTFWGSYEEALQEGIFEALKLIDK